MNLINDKIKRLNDLSGKEIINMNDGERLGIIADSDLIINEETGKIEALLVPNLKSPFKLFSNREEIKIPWGSIVKIANDLVFIDIDKYEKY